MYCSPPVNLFGVCPNSRHAQGQGQSHTCDMPLATLFEYIVNRQVGARHSNPSTVPFKGRVTCQNSENILFAKTVAWVV